MTNPIEAEDLTRVFGDLTAVNSINLSVNEGEVFGFLGPNGAGKSTAVRMLTTLLKPSDGSAKVSGYDVATEANMVRKNIGVALQDAAIDPLMTGNELLKLQAVLHGIPRQEGRARCAELLERVGLTAAGDKRVGTYSGGMRRRLDLALSLVHRPKVLFLDEPTTGLDPTSRVALWEEVRTLNKEIGTTVFLTTQYLEEADQLAQRIAIIDNGRIVREGSPATLKAGVGAPTLRVDITDADFVAAKEIMNKLGEERPARKGRIAIGLDGGTRAITAVLKALEDQDIEVQHVELDEPSLDDVFADATGRRLEGGENT
ncbi:MAG: daunorubicin ABC transporter ATP-binding protein [Acidimicrobiaceae bacterium TMED130]|nr:MAG: daunorubicin ABC transporter ATP-binding protein [Acidimicrobiaceae bacterium TMED130]|tara:strand:- start:8367 stop:9314 length:948 start_codon:yes stop_codon:yes gene_type:complete